jgi:hypothetical protein
VAAALQIWSATYSRAFDNLPMAARLAVQDRVDDMDLTDEDADFSPPVDWGCANFSRKFGWLYN